MGRTYGSGSANYDYEERRGRGYNPNNGGNHAMAWVSFGLSLVSLLLIFFLNIPILFIVLGIICLILAIVDVVHSGKSVPAIIAIVITIVILLLSGLAWYGNAKAIEEYNKSFERFSTLNDLGSGGGTSTDDGGWHVNDYLQDLDDSMDTYGY